MTEDVVDLAGFDALSDDAAVGAVLTCCSSPEFARTLVAGRPYTSVDALLLAADAALAELPESEIDAALAGHPRIGGRAESAASAREQAGVSSADDAVRAALADGNAAYERKFGHLYLVCASGRSGAELLEVLTGRLDNDPATERRIVRAELGKINRLRLRRLLGADA